MNTGRPLVVVLTGAECTGKTRLAAWLAERFACTWVPEFAREYAEHHRPLGPEDVEPIARGQQAAAEQARERATGALIVHDTDLVSTVVYGRYLYGHCPAWVEAAAQHERGDLYLWLHPDVPWVPDADQRSSPEARDAQHAAFERALAEFGIDQPVAIRGGWDLRHSRAAAAVEAALDRVR